MTNFQDRQRAEEKKYQLNKEQEFKVVMRRNKLFADWLADEVAMDKDTARTRIIDADFEKPGSDDVIAEAMKIIAEQGQDKKINADILNKKLQEYHAIAKQQVVAEI